MKMKSCYQQTKDLLEDDILYRTTQMKLLCINAEEAACRTIVYLSDQNEQLTNVHRHLNCIDQTLDETEKPLKLLKTFARRARDLFRRKFQKKSRKIIDESVSFSRPCAEKSVAPPTTLDDDLDGMIARLRILAEDMNGELARQNVLLGSAHDDMLESTNQLNKRNAQIEKLLFFRK